MYEIEGRYSIAKVFLNRKDIEESTISQIKKMCDQPFAEGSKVRIMPDCHYGKGCTIGTTMTITDKVVPSIVGVDIGCGVDVIKLDKKRIDLPKLDSFIKENIPHGRDVRKRSHRSHGRIDIEELRCFKKIDRRRAKESLGTLGGGNHFIEIDKDSDSNLYLLIHTGSRKLGLTVAEYYQKLAYKNVGGKNQDEIDYYLAQLEDESLGDYLHDMNIMQEFAKLNRQIIKEVILDGMKLEEVDFFSSVHNYIDLDVMILRKGAVSAKKGEKLIIPLNMRDGALICTGKGNEDWNYSAPHGTGRLFGRKEAENRFTLKEFIDEMDGIFTTTVDRGTLDECPMAYKPYELILDAISDTVDVVKMIRPIYNFKASENKRK